jgi:hypothetical protein
MFVRFIQKNKVGIQSEIDLGVGKLIALEDNTLEFKQD